ncbi:MAG: Gfo/Idh/MocA family oxidoreductase, partial [Oscillospiraceae bacterium]
MDKKIRVGVFGAFRGMTMIEVMAKHPDAELVAICDRYEPALEKCREVQRQTGSSITYYTDFEDFFKHDMDAVVLANYATEHAPYAIRLLKSGRHVTSEVLPVQTPAEAVALCEAVEESGRVYTYSENYCYFHGTAEIRRLYREGVLGELLHAEGEYVHDMEGIWPDKTYGDKDHWRNRMFSTFYCTHALGPIVHITGLRPVKVVGFETPNVERYAKLGFKGGSSSLIILQMENGATVKVLDGKLLREPYPVWYSLYGQKGSVETDRFDNSVNKLYLYEPESNETKCSRMYQPRPVIDSALSKSTKGHGGSDFYTM